MMVIIRGFITKGIGDAKKNLQLQKRFFEIDDKLLENGTINVDIHPSRWEILKPDIVIKDIVWGKGFKESFSFIEVKIRYKNKRYSGYMYIASNSQNGRNVIEVLAEKIRGIENGKPIELRIPYDKLKMIG